MGQGHIREFAEPQLFGSDVVTYAWFNNADEDLIKYAWPEDVWFHVDKLSSAHVYVEMPEGMSRDAIPEPVLIAGEVQLN